MTIDFDTKYRRTIGTAHGIDRLVSIPARLRSTRGGLHATPPPYLPGAPQERAPRPGFIAALQPDATKYSMASQPFPCELNASAVCMATLRMGRIGVDGKTLVPMLDQIPELARQIRISQSAFILDVGSNNGRWLVEMLIALCFDRSLFA